MDVYVCQVVARGLLDAVLQRGWQTRHRFSPWSAGRLQDMFDHRPVASLPLQLEEEPGRSVQRLRRWRW